MSYLFLILFNLEMFKNSTTCEINVSSGNRTIGHNIKVGGHKRSYHIMNSMALDLVKNKCPLNYTQLGFIAILYFNGVLVYDDHLHVDLRPYKYLYIY